MYGQMVYIDREAEVAIVKFSSRDSAADDRTVTPHLPDVRGACRGARAGVRLTVSRRTIETDGSHVEIEEAMIA